MDFNEADLNRVVDVLRETARGEVIARFRADGNLEATEKTSRLDLITAADEVAEARIAEKLSSTIPDCVSACNFDPLSRGGGVQN